MYKRQFIICALRSCLSSPPPPHIFVGLIAKPASNSLCPLSRFVSFFRVSVSQGNCNFSATLFLSLTLFLSVRFVVFRCLRKYQKNAARATEKTANAITVSASKTKRVAITARQDLMGNATITAIGLLTQFARSQLNSIRIIVKLTAVFQPKAYNFCPNLCKRIHFTQRPANNTFKFNIRIVVKIYHKF